MKTVDLKNEKPALSVDAVSGALLSEIRQAVAAYMWSEEEEYNRIYMKKMSAFAR